MTEYDFSPQAYQRHLANMHHVSRWVDHTEQHRPHFADAAVLATLHTTVDAQKESSPRQLLPLPLSVVPYHHGMHFYVHPISPQLIPPVEEFLYAATPGSPGPMPASMYQDQILSSAPSYGHQTSSWSSVPHDPHLQSHVFSHEYGYPAMPLGYVAVSAGRSNLRKKSSSKRRRSKLAPLVVSSPPFVFSMPS